MVSATWQMVQLMFEQQWQLLTWLWWDGIVALAAAVSKSQSASVQRESTALCKVEPHIPVLHNEIFHT